MTIKVLMVFGTRPEAIKMAPLYHALKEKTCFHITLCVTGQHKEMLDQVLEVFEINPDINLKTMRKAQDLRDITTAVLDGISLVIKKLMPDIVLVHGDTTTTFSTALAAFYLNIPVGHVEAGLRTNNITLPYPEEFNRQVTSKIAQLHFTPTEISKQNLINEGHKKGNIVVTGNTVIDALHWVLTRLNNDIDRKKRVISTVSDKLSFDWENSQYVLITTHRRENFGEGLINICEALIELAERYKNFNFVYPVHLNPNVQEPVKALLSKSSNIHLIAPLDYEPFIAALNKCYFVLTDSGGIQEEAPSLGKPVLVMRDFTERPEGLESGSVRLVGANKNKIVEEVSLLIEDKMHYLAMAQHINPYGDGKACLQIIKVIMEKFNEKVS